MKPCTDGRRRLTGGRFLTHAVLLVTFLTPIVWMRAQIRILDDFETLHGWRALPSEGATLTLASGKGNIGKAMVMEFDLSRAAGYVIAQKDFAIDLAPDYQFLFDLRAEAPVNNFEFKLLDSLENVYWIKKLDVEYPRTWTRMRIKRRQIKFAWGPTPGAELQHVKKIEFVVSVGTGGKGKVWIDNLTFEPLYPQKNPKPAEGSASSTADPRPSVIGDSLLTTWRSSSSKAAQWVAINFH